MKLALEVKNLVKAYGNNTVVKGISFDVKEGEIFALLGINGAGKTTTLECIEGLRKYGEGEIRLSGNIGVQLQISSLPEHITVLEATKLFCVWNSAPVNMTLLASLGLTELKNKQYRALSTGQKRRLHLALALVTNPEILFLDEPTSGLDVEGRAALHVEIRRLKANGKTIIMASHDMAEVQSLCDRIAIIKNGEIVYIGTPSDLTVDVSTDNVILIKADKAFATDSIAGCTYMRQDGDYSVFSTDSIRDGLLALLETAKKDDVTILDVKIDQATLEQRFLAISKDIATDIAKDISPNTSSDHLKEVN